MAGLQVETDYFPKGQSTFSFSFYIFFIFEYIGFHKLIILNPNPVNMLLCKNIYNIWYVDLHILRTNVLVLVTPLNSRAWTGEFYPILDYTWSNPTELKSLVTPNKSPEALGFMEQKKLLPVLVWYQYLNSYSRITISKV